jgi:hypothetical protein
MSDFAAAAVALGVVAISIWKRLQLSKAQAAWQADARTREILRTLIEKGTVSKQGPIECLMLNEEKGQEGAALGDSFYGDLTLLHIRNSLEGAEQDPLIDEFRALLIKHIDMDAPFLNGDYNKTITNNTR